MGTSLYGAIPLNVDVNQLGASANPRLSITQPSPYYSALVEDVILNEDHPNYDRETGSNIGDARVRFLPGDRNVPVDKLNWACPVESGLEDYPLKNETVLVYFALGRLFYSRRINSTKKVGEATWPGLSTTLGPPVTGKDKTETMLRAADGVEPYDLSNKVYNDAVAKIPLQNPNARRVRASQGDMILYGRFGNVIRVGSNLMADPEIQVPEPNILLTTGLHTPAEVSTNNSTIFSLMYENINLDKSSIWMVSNQTVPFVASTARSQAENKAHLASSSDRTTVYDGAQIFINSDRVILNSKQNEISLFSNNEINLSAIRAITIDTENSVFMTANQEITLDAEGDIFIKGRTIALKADRELSYKTSGNYSIVGKQIFIGSHGDTTQPMVLGTKLAVFLQQLVSTLNVNLQTAFLPQPTPTAAAALVALTTQLGDLQSSLTNPLAAPFNSRDNFTTERNTV
jgi:hypothetical protein